MNLSEFLQNQHFMNAAFGLGGGVLTWLMQQIFNKRGTFTYSVNHNRVGISTNDAIFGSVGVTFNGNAIPNLYLSTIDLVNESMNDYENVIIHAFTNDTKLLTEQTQILGTPKTLEWSAKYKAQLSVSNNESPSQEQFNVYGGQREYLIPVINRGQSVRLTYLNSATTNEMPNIWLDVSQKGVKVKFQPPQNTVLGIPQSRAAVLGLGIGLIFVWWLITIPVQLWVAVMLAFAYGLVAQVPGAYVIKLWRKCRDIIGS